MSQYPTDVKYTKEHEWARVEGDLVRVGITAYAVEQLGDVTLVDLPSVGATVTAHERFGDIESVKTVSELFSPISGEVVEVNEDLDANPELVNDAPYDKGWLIVIKPSNLAELDELLDAAGYEAFLGSLDH
ncbi:MAG: glycine cleavage system protein GcvH [Myxococcales bacterium]|jgi:glycine cleavage system H protein|nr:glycine cleavage system protein GcvH [Myxococcales bacterium]